MSERPKTWRTLLSRVPQSEPHEHPNVVPMRRRQWNELAREIVEASAAFSRLVDDDDLIVQSRDAERKERAAETERIENAYQARRDEIAAAARIAFDRVETARRMFGEKCMEEVRAKVNFIDEIVEGEAGE